MRSGGRATPISPTTFSGSSLIAPPRFSPNRTRRRSARTANASRRRSRGCCQTICAAFRGSKSSISRLRNHYSESFRASVEAAVKAKNEAVAAENTVNRVKYEAQQNVEKANGDALARLRIADAERQAAILQAQGKSEAIRLEGEARANVLRLNAQVLKESSSLIDLIRADRWNGTLPSVLLEGSNATPLLALP